MMDSFDSRKNVDDSLCVIKEVTIKNSNGLHARPAALFVKTANRFRVEISVEKEGELINGKSIMGLMMLAAAKGSQIRLIAKGEEAAAAIAALEELIMNSFGEA
jgi:phosphocarrier protein